MGHGLNGLVVTLSPSSAAKSKFSGLTEASQPVPRPGPGRGLNSKALPPRTAVPVSSRALSSVNRWRNTARLLAGSMPKPSSSVTVTPRPTPHRTRPPDNRSRVASRSATRTGWWIGSGRGEPELDAFGFPRHGREQHVGRGGVAKTPQEVVFSEPDGA